ncbi:MAG: fumarate hydratase [Candidatus Omnitrophica bacterium]|nr:fumarate hydratase [Candidatus Omnitrophota bacterium]
MRKIDSAKVSELVRRLAIEANIRLRKDVLIAIKRALRTETKLSARRILKILVQNARLARDKSIPICQDTGFVEVFCRIGQEVIVKGALTDAINKGVELGYRDGFLRKSVVSDPLLRNNTKTNTPCVIHYDVVKGDRIEIIVVPKGFGSENASSLVMLKPTDTEETIVNFVLDTVKRSGYDACPPLIIGIGMGGTMDKAALLATQAITLKVGRKQAKKHLARIEDMIMTKLNKTGIGPAGLGGKTTCLGVNILSFPTHIAGLPLCVKVSCHATRSAKGVI